MIALDIPLHPVDEDEGHYVIFLPGVRTDQLESVSYDIDEEEEIFNVYCVYGEDEEGRPEGDMYPIDMNDQNRSQIDGLEELAVLNPRDYDPADLTEDPEDQKQLEELFEGLYEMEEELFGSE